MKDWTILVYMAGDNNLSENMAFSLDEIATAANEIPTISTPNQDMSGRQLATKDVNLLVFFDGNSLTAPTQYIDYSGEEPEIENNISKHRVYGSRSSKNAPGKEGNSASANSILNFINWCIKTQNRVARNYAVIFSGHSFGFHGTSFLRDESDGGYITLWRFRWALQTAVDEIFGKKIAILGFDSCVMSMLEVGCELKAVATSMIASEGSLPNSGWSYTALLNKFLPKFKSDVKKDFTSAITNAEKQKAFVSRFNLAANPFISLMDTNLSDAQSQDANQNKSLGAEEIVSIDFIINEIVELPEYVRATAKEFVTDLISRQNRLLVGGRSIDIAAWNLEKVKDVAENFNELARVFNKHFAIRTKVESGSLEDDDIAVFWELKKILLQAHYNAQTYMNEQCVDLKDFCKLLIIESLFVLNRNDLKPAFTEIIRKCKAVIASIDDCVIQSGFSGDEYQYSNGISVFFPWSHLTMELTNYRYQYLIFSQGDLRPADEERRDLNNYYEYEGVGKDWYFFLMNYLYNVTLRQTRVTKVPKLGEDGEPVLDDAGRPVYVSKHSALEDFTKSNPIWSRSNPIWSKSNPIWSRSNPDASRSNPDTSRSNPIWSRSNPDASRSNPDASRSNPDASRSNPVWSKGEFGNYLFYFARFKNFENRWDVTGFANQFGFETDFEGQETTETKSENENPEVER